ncbi:malto-oligosyltrehalose synthase [Streptomyces sp. NPDC048639]|uniref:malto-oligosyltrehalose synthase n=1 Tax=Streptomyces sp. NPDC048639 TaxID=3365581 RepID=UPI0037217C2A
MTPVPETPRPVAPPTATYRLQLQPEFPFGAAAAAVPYLASLGVSHLHLSPVLEAVPGSTHGYDVVDHSAVRAELGGEDGLRALSRTAREHGLGLVVDIVPNHMAVPAPEHLNRPLWEVLRDGPESPYARWFDIDRDLHGGRVLMPVLGGRLGDELDHIRLDGDVLRYHDHAFPVRPGTAHLPLPELLDAQWYRLAWWRLARTELNYRRFFTVSTLIGVRVEDPEVFDATHAKVLELLREGVVDGLRVDHPDGLADPGAYLRRLDRATGDRWTVVEKILTGGERLPADWPVAGTTGYDALRRVDGLFVDPSGATELLGVYRGFTAQPPDRGGEWSATARRAAYKVVTHELAAEVSWLARIAARICEADVELRDHAPWALRAALREVLVRLPVYRPYAIAGERVPEGDADMLRSAARRARTVFTVPEEAEAVDLVRDLALGLLGAGPDHTAFCARFAQTSSALRAKSVEDTAFYRYVPLLSAGEVGGEPGGPAVSADAFHAFCVRLQRDWPLSGTAVSTHDTKRSADVRARIALLTEAPDEWAELLERVTKEIARGDGTRAPDPHVAWTAWQTVFGLGFPDADGAEGDGADGNGAGAEGNGNGAEGNGNGAEGNGNGDEGNGNGAKGNEDEGGGGVADRTDGRAADRIVAAVVKAVREAGLRTSWTEGDPDYEAAVEAFLRAGPCGPPRDAMAAFGRTLMAAARANILGTALTQLTMPGVPDVYQGTELEYAALVDPDNRHPARFRPRLIAALDEGRTPDGVTEEKLRLTATALRLRRQHPGWFGESGAYEALIVTGSAAAHCVAFSRGGGAVTAVTRLSRRLEESGGWRDTTLALPDEGPWTDLLSRGRTVRGDRVRAADLFTESPVALLVRG